VGSRSHSTASCQLRDVSTATLFRKRSVNYESTVRFLVVENSQLSAVSFESDHLRLYECFSTAVNCEFTFKSEFFRKRSCRGNAPNKIPEWPPGVFVTQSPRRMYHAQCNDLCQVQGRWLAESMTSVNSRSLIGWIANCLLRTCYKLHPNSTPR